MDDVNIAILAAGLGTRLARPIPKTLTRLSSGESILDRQVGGFRVGFGDRARVMVVVGFKLEMVMEAAPDLVYVYNERFDRTNTSKSLLKALRAAPSDCGLLWTNGDVVFGPEVVRRLAEYIARDASFVAVNAANVGEEEVTYTLHDGDIERIGKGLAGGLGEAVGINYVASTDRAKLVRRLEECDEQDYFEQAIDWTIARDAMSWAPLDISDLYAEEVDFEEDLARVNAHLSAESR